MALPRATTAEFILFLARRNGVCKPQVGTWRGKAFQALVLLLWFVFGSALASPRPLQSAAGELAVAVPRTLQPAPSLRHPARFRLTGQSQEGPLL